MDEYSHLPDSDFLLPGTRALPIFNREHWLLARTNLMAIAELSEAERLDLLRSWVEVGMVRGYLDDDSMAQAMCDLAASGDIVAEVMRDSFQAVMREGHGKVVGADGEPMDQTAIMREFFDAAMERRQPQVYHRFDAADMRAIFQSFTDANLPGLTKILAGVCDALVERSDLRAGRTPAHQGIDGVMAEAARRNFRYWFPDAFRRAFPDESEAAVADAIARLEAADGPDVLLTDAMVAEDLVVIQDAAEGKPMRVKVLLTRANVRNGNRRIYPFAVLKDMVERFQSYVYGRVVTMEWLHPETIYDDGYAVGWATNPLRDVCVIDRMYMDGDAVYVDVTMMNTPYGVVIQEQIRAKKKPPVSLRALGRTQPAVIAGESVEIATRLTAYGGDWVPNPALPEAGPVTVLTDSQIYEALLVGAKEESMDIKQMQAQLDALTKTGRPEDQQKIAELTQAIADAKAEQAKTEGDMKALADAKVQAEKTLADVKDQLAEAQKKGADTDALRGLVDSLGKTVEGLASQVKAMTDAAEADKQAKAAAAAKAEVTAFADSVVAREEVKVFPAEIQTAIVDRVKRAENKEAAEKALTDAIGDFNQTLAMAKLAAQGYQPGAGGVAGKPTGATPRIEVTDNPKPWKPVVDAMSEAFRNHARLTNVQMPVDESIRKANQPFVDALIEQVVEQEGAAIIDSAQAITDSIASGRALPITDAANTTTSNLWNQPTLLLALLVQQFQNLEALQFVQGIGPKGFTQAIQGQNKLGSVLRLPVEYYEAPAGSENLPYYDDGMIVGENQAIPEIMVSTRWLTFLPVWRRLAFSLTAEAEEDLMSGPLSYDSFARHMFHLTLAKSRKIDRALFEEMLLNSAEYGAVAVANEAVAAGEWTYDGAGNVGGYGANVCGVAQLLCGGAAGNANTLVPVVRPRKAADLNAAGQMVAQTDKNAFTVAALGGVDQVLGYLDGNGNIQSIGNTTATYAIDWLNGKVCFKATATSGAAAGVRPTISYSYETNYDVFQISNPRLAVGETINDYYAKLLQQIDTTAAGMGSHPRFMPPDLGLMSLTVATYIQNAATFQNWNSPVGSRLIDPRITSNSKFAERNGVELAKINTPWSAADSRILLSRQGSTKYGVEKPFEIKAPVQVYDPATGKPLDAKSGYGREKSVICTPQVTKQDDSVVNPVSRTLILR